jgi:hypothetical protein
VAIIKQIKMCIPVSRVTVLENVKLTPLPPPKKRFKLMQFNL